MAATINLFLILSTTFFRYNTCTSLPKFPASLFFGDSQLDTGNNNYIKTWIKANYLPYGPDYPGHVPTGRFSNGKLISDLLASILRIKDTVPPFLDPTLADDELITGVNFASAGSGFDDSTSLLTNVIPLSNQIEYFKDYIKRLKGIVGEDKAMEIINGALVVLSAGTNDWIYNFYDIPTRRLQFNVGGYPDFLLNKLENFTKELYDFGCRKMVISGIFPVGCLPLQMTLNLQNPSRKRCLEDQNTDAKVYNQKLVKLLTKLQAALPGTKIVYNDVYGPVMDMTTHPNKYGFVETRKGCCGSGPFGTSFFCDPKSATCKDTSKFLYWDMVVHLTLTSWHYMLTYMVNNVILKSF